MKVDTTEDAAKPLFEWMEATLNKFDESSCCPSCSAKIMLSVAGLFAAERLQPDELHEVLAHIAEMAEEHGSPVH
jgi:hypothetical protein